MGKIKTPFWKDAAAHYAGRIARWRPLDQTDVRDGDAALRPALEGPTWNGLTDWIAALAAARRGSRALLYGSYRNVVLTNRQLVFQRAVQGERVIVAVNADGEEYTAHFDARAGRGTDLITGELHDFGGGSQLPPYSVAYWRTE